MNRKYDVLTFGEILLRLSPVSQKRVIDSHQLNTYIGGAEVNVASSLSMLGQRVALASKIPAHDIGEYVKRNIQSQGISDEYIVTDFHKEARLGIYFYESGAFPRKPKVIYDRQHTVMNTVSINDFPTTIFKSAKVFHTTGITLALNENSQTTTIEMMKRCKEQGCLISFDVNYRANLWKDSATAKACIESILPYVDIFFCSESTAQLTFLKQGKIEDIMKEFSNEYDISIVCSTQRIVHTPKCHTFTSLIFDKNKNQYYQEPAYQNIDVVDRIGSGDAYIAGVLYGLLSSNMDAQKALEYGNALGAIKNTIAGDILISSKAEIDKIIQEHQSQEIGLEMER